jgi:hypothetical protein
MDFTIYRRSEAFKKRTGAGRRCTAGPKQNMDKNPLQKVREALYERLANFDFTEDMLKDKSLFQLVTLEMLLVGHRNYIGTYTCTCRTLEELFGDQFWYRKEKSTNIVREDHEPKPMVN